MPLVLSLRMMRSAISRPTDFRSLARVPNTSGSPAPRRHSTCAGWSLLRAIASRQRYTADLPGGAHAACSARYGCALPDARSLCARMRAITPGSSMLATIFSRAPQRAHASIWMPNTRFRRCAQRSATWAAVGSVDTDLSFSSQFELYRTDVPDDRVATRRVVEALDVVEHV